MLDSIRESSEPIGFYCFGVSYLDVARLAWARKDEIAFRDPIEFLVAHGLELIFKADLRRGLTLESVKDRYGHNLKRMFKDVSQEFKSGFQVDEQLNDIVQFLSIGHSGPNWRNRYLETGLRADCPSVDWILSGVAPFTNDHRKFLAAHFSRQRP